ncbi:MAG: hypothetical protein AB8G11_09875 [Saprospiraceae bacterium]
MKKFILSSFTLFLIFITITVSAQKAKLDRANSEFERYNFAFAIELYQEILEKKDIVEAKINLAECYRKVDNMAEAEYWYGQIVHLPEAKPIYYLYYAKALYANGKCDLAKPWFEKYEATLDENTRVEKSIFEITDCDEFDKLINPRNHFYEVRKLPFNTKYDDFSPVFFNGGLIFVSERNYKPTNVYDNIREPFFELFFTNIDTIYSEAKEYEYNQELENYSKNLKTQYHDGTICFNKYENKVYFTRHNLIINKNNTTKELLKIFTADVQDDKWINVQELPFNSDEYSVAYPTLSLDGKTLYFSSDMSGGFGGMDLYYAVFENGQWSPPHNLGPRINTKKHEVFPYIHASGRLYFSSDGHFGLGGLDIYYCNNNEGVFSKITNLGFPINAITDDYGIILNEEKTFGYFTSDREGGEGLDDIYSFKYDVVKAEILVYDEKTNEPIQGVEVLNDCSNGTLTTDENGKVVFELPLNKCCSFITNKENYGENIVESCTHDYKSGRKIFLKISLSRK